MRNIKLTVEYDGRPYYGFQRQSDPRLISVQSELEAAIKAISGQEITLNVAGRTDKGVHATAQICNFHMATNLKRINFIDGLNNKLPNNIAVLDAEDMPEDFHARHSAIARSYRFIILNRRIRSPLWDGRATLIRPQLDEKLMHNAAQILVGENDFTSFQSAECQSSTPMVHLQKIDVQREGDLIHIELAANHFLHNMVRIIAGTLSEIGSGRRPANDLAHLLKAKDRTQAGPTIAPYGLYLTKVHY